MNKANTIYGKKLRKADAIMYSLIYVAAFLSVFLILGIILYVFVHGIGQNNWTFLTTASSFLKGTVGIAGNIVNTLFIVVITLLIAIPVGVGSAIYLNEYARPEKVIAFIEFATETLSGIPSIWSVWYGVFRKNLGLFYSDRCVNLNDYGIAAYYKKYTGSTENGTIKLQAGFPWDLCNKVVYDSYCAFAKFDAWYYYRCYSGYWTNCRGKCSTFIYRGKR